MNGSHPSATHVQPLVMSLPTVPQNQCGSTKVKRGMLSWEMERKMELRWEEERKIKHPSRDLTEQNRVGMERAGIYKIKLEQPLFKPQ